MSTALQSGWTACFDQYMESGGFPEAGQPSMNPHRTQLLQGYVDTVLFRDVAERHGIVNLQALRAFVRQLLRQPASLLSITKLHADFRSRGISIAKETLLALLAHLEDAFLVFTIPVATRSERRQQVNPRKLYPCDPGLIPVYDRSGKSNLGHALETAVALELKRRGAELAYGWVEGEGEIDFVADFPAGDRRFIQVVWQMDDAKTLSRELRPFNNQKGDRLLLTGDYEGAVMAQKAAPTGVKVMPAWVWMLSTGSDLTQNHVFESEDA
jgi:predicted AAA+ superfamily ATPase